MLKNRTFIVFGIGGIGSACARRASEAGANVVLSSRSAAKIAPLADSLVQERTLVVTGDASKITELENVFRQAKEKFGTIDAVIIAIGTWLRLSLDETPDDALKSVDNAYATLFRPGFAVAYRAQQILREQNHGLIVNFSSHVATRHDLPDNHSYSGMKTAGRKFILDMAHEFKETPGCLVRACDISPATVNTPGNEQFFASDEDKAKAIQPEAMADWIIEHLDDPNIPVSKGFETKEGFKFK